MPYDSIQNKVIIIVANQLEIDRKDVKPESHFINDLGIDSLDLAEIILTVEAEFKLEIKDSDIENMHSVKDLSEYVLHLMSKALPTQDPTPTQS